MPRRGTECPFSSGPGAHCSDSPPRKIIWHQISGFLSNNFCRSLVKATTGARQKANLNGQNRRQYAPTTARATPWRRMSFAWGREEHEAFTNGSAASMLTFKPQHMIHQKHDTLTRLSPQLFKPALLILTQLLLPTCWIYTPQERVGQLPSSGAHPQQPTPQQQAEQQETQP